MARCGTASRAGRKAGRLAEGGHLVVCSALSAPLPSGDYTVVMRSAVICRRTVTIAPCRGTIVTLVLPDAVAQDSAGDPALPLSRIS